MIGKAAHPLDSDATSGWILAVCLGFFQGKGMGMMGTETLPWTTVGWIVMGITLLTGLNSTWFFLGRLRVGLTGWLMLNSCAPSIFLFAVGYLLRSPLLMAAGALWMFRYGTLGCSSFLEKPHRPARQFGMG
jgi:hypothetical protein